jgi:LCP family protein required for cell wall assembly
MKRLSITLSIIALLAIFGVLSIIPVTAQDTEDTGWDGESRFTVLVLGMDRRPGARDTFRVRTDVNILISIDPATQSLGMLHIPRDFHLTPYGTVDFVRVNTLMIEGEEIAEGNGPYFAMETFQYNLGMYIDRYVAFDFEAFVAIIDALGGIRLDILYPISDPTYPDMNGGFDPFVIDAGIQTLDGETALQFARTRHGDNDFERGERQLQVIEGIYDRLQQDGMLASLIPQAPLLLNQIQNNIYTDIPLTEIIQLIQVAVTIPRENISTNTLGQSDYYISYATTDGRNVYIPNRSTLVELLTDTFGENYPVR